MKVLVSKISLTPLVFSTWSRALGLGAVFAGLDMAPVRGAPGENILITSTGSYDRDP